MRRNSGRSPATLGAIKPGVFDTSEQVIGCIKCAAKGQAPFRDALMTDQFAAARGNVTRTNMDGYA